MTDSTGKEVLSYRTERMFTYSSRKSVKCLVTGKVKESTFATFMKTNVVQTKNGPQDVYSFINIGCMPGSLDERIVPVCQFAEWSSGYDGAYADFGHDILVLVDSSVQDNESMFGINLFVASNVEQLNQNPFNRPKVPIIYWSKVKEVRLKVDVIAALHP